MGDWDQEADTLFVRFPLTQVQAKEKETRASIEKKKEDLRHMVGERYRDLIDAADTILKMASVSAEVLVSCSHMHRLLTQAQSASSRVLPSALDSDSPTAASAAATSARSLTSSPMSSVYTVAMQVKALVETPERVWNSLEKGKFSLAAMLYSLARGIYTRMKVEKDEAIREILPAFPIIHSHWGSIAHFKQRILADSRAYLSRCDTTDVPRDPNAVAEGDQNVMSALAAIMLLDDKPIKAVFEEFLDHRRQALRELFQSEFTALSGEAQQQRVILSLYATLRQVYVIFGRESGSDASNMAKYMTKLVSDKSGEGGRPVWLVDAEFMDSVLSPSIPQYILSFSPLTKEMMEEISSQTIKEKCTAWVTEGRTEVQKGITATMLQDTCDVQALAAARNSLWALLSGLGAGDSSTGGRKWEEWTAGLVDTRLSLWDFFLRAPFLIRVKAIISDKCTRVLEETNDMAEKGLAQLLQGKAADGMPAAQALSTLDDLDMSQRVWAADLIASLDAAVVKEDSESAPLGKGPVSKDISNVACGWTASVLGVWERFTTLLADVHDDALHYAVAARAGSQTAVQAYSPFDKAADSKEIIAFLQEACERCVEGVVQRMKEKLVDLKSAVSAVALPVRPNDGDAVRSHQRHLACVTYLGRVLKCLAERCEPLERTMRLGQAQQDDTSMSAAAAGLADDALGAKGGLSALSSFSSRLNARKITRTRGQAQLSEGEKRLVALRDLLASTSKDCFLAWAEAIAQLRLANLTCALQAWDLTNTFGLVKAWQDFDVKEETEGGATVQSKIKVPTQAALFLTRELCGLCGDVSVAGSYVLPAGVLPDLLGLVSRGLVDAYARFIGLPPASTEGADSRPSPVATVSPIPQAAAVQMLLDVQYASDVLAGRGKDDAPAGERLQATVRALRELIDPFDLDVLSPHLEQARARLYQRTALLLGNLTSLAPLHTSAPLPSSASTEQHNTLALATGAPRFPLLPISSSLSSSQSSVSSSSAGAGTSSGPSFAASSVGELDLSRVFSYLTSTTSPQL